jgi:hypothetical protein
MTTRRPARLTLMILNGFLSGNEPLTGDLLEEFDSGRSQWWLLRQAAAAALYEMRPTSATIRGDMNTILLGAGLLAVLSLEVVMVANVLRRFMFGPPLQGINGYLYLFLFHRNMADPSVPSTIGSTGNWTLAVTIALAIIVSTALGFMFARVHDGHRQRSVLLTTAVFVSAALNMGFTLGLQVVITAVFIAGLIVGGRVFSLNTSDATERHSIV